MDSDTMDVRVMTPDELFGRMTTPDVIKLDVEGAEVDALEGALGLLAGSGPVVRVEIHWLGDQSLNLARDRPVPLGDRPRPCSAIRGLRRRSGSTTC